MKIVNGDLITLAQEGNFDVIAHGCNCFCLMGAGIAKQIKQTYPAAYTADKETKAGDMSKLSEFTKSTTNNLTVYNLYTQYHPGPEAEYQWVKECLTNMREDVTKDTRIGLPAIGCGIGGLYWYKVLEIIEDVFDGYNVTVVLYNQ